MALARFVRHQNYVLGKELHATPIHSVTEQDSGRFATILDDEMLLQACVEHARQGHGVPERAMKVIKLPAKGAGLVLFDLDGTLIDAAADIAAAATPVLASHGLAPLSQSEAKSLLGNGLHAFIKRAFALRGAWASVEDVQTYVEAYESAPIAKTRLYPGTESVLRELRDDGWTMAVCTNKIESAAEKVLGELGVLSCFQAVCGGDTVHACKPDPNHLHIAVERTGILSGVAGEKYDCIAIGWTCWQPTLAAYHPLRVLKSN